MPEDATVTYPEGDQPDRKFERIIGKSPALEALEEAGWVVGGPQGAAVRLGVKRTTLLARMRRLGISRSITQGATDMATESMGEDAQL